MQTVEDAQSLVTTRNDIVAGFRWQEEEKARRANEFHAIALHFCASAGRIQSVATIIGDARLYQFALGACALSAKGARQLGAEVCRQIIEATIDLQRLTDAAYVAELERRYLLTCGDALGGSMRNAIGQRAQNKLSDFVCQYLAEGQIQARVTRNAGGKITEISWANRTLAFDRKPRFINKNIDFILMDAPRFAAATLEQPQRLIAFGELKGGIDPAGADEHWKTARAALDRVRQAYADRQLAAPSLFFVGAAIEQSMAVEIFAQLTNNALTAAANLHHQGQLAELTQILTDL
ncbi:MULTISPECIES: AvaI/BsoBI family type II restriction endonuclease [Novosphingobium]|uniref:AvaI/BsoBI family type II restriction endonuclease n=1 Tax=Novosphingobium TaxID=165696 RepID=UPI000D6E6BBC|nr:MULTISPECIES: AvaI/BsoBI family type II restriction endonuclease [Novosphingobium]